MKYLYLSILSVLINLRSFMNSINFSIILGVFLSLALFNMKTEARDNTFDKLIISATKKPYYTALLVYTALWAKNNLDSYSRRNPGRLGIWIAYLIAQGFSEDDANIMWPLILMPEKGFFGGNS